MRHEGPKPPWWRPKGRVVWRVELAKRLAYERGYGDATRDIHSELYKLLEKANYFK